ncbi:TMF-regulated nuclear protein 1 [Merluccius polli]|uniref:TMF-regulated nuclear protein 1 n=1 Tax=Merluccius polli TaxID=89951 RepID=A0AA47ND59_MERPO|nr:TMF-regulated nuclear protein 1 [Merluccius polli]
MNEEADETRMDVVRERQRHADDGSESDEDAMEDVSLASACVADPHPYITPPPPPDAPSASSSSSSSSSFPPPAAGAQALFPLTLPPSTSATALLAMASPATRRSISMGDFRRVTGALLLPRSGPPSASATAPSSKLVTPSSSMEFEAARRRLLEVEERQRVIREMERRLEELRQVFVRSEQEVVVHGEVVSRIYGGAQQGELSVAENTQRAKKGLRFKKHRPTIIFSSMLGLRTCLPWPVKLK